MKSTGIIVEYNPFHNGHILHINKTKDLCNPDILIAVLSGNWVQRGEPAVVNKWERARIALKYEVNLVVELPYVYAVQNADKFAYGAVKILDLLNADNVVFGSECGNIESLKEIAEAPFDINRFKENINAGYSYPASYDFFDDTLGPNDILGIAYLKALKDTNIKPYVIKRETAYYSEDLQETASALAIRKAIKEKKDISVATPMKIKKMPLWDDYYPYLRSLLVSTDNKELKKRFLVNEGLENKLVKTAFKCDTYEEFLTECISRRYTKARIQRTLVHILNQVNKEDIENLPEMNYVRVLASDKKGYEYLSSLRKKDIIIASKYNQIPKEYRDIEYKATFNYSLGFKNKNEIIKQEIYGQYK